MKYSYKWLKDLSKTNNKVDDLIELVSSKGFELDGKDDLGSRFDNFVVGAILEVKKHSDADKLNICQVDVGSQCLQIVCGAPNVEVGQKVPVALIGATVPANGFEIKKTKIRGQDSYGMICAEDELSLGKKHEGIMILDKALKPGIPLSEALKLDDFVLDFDILPDRAHDCLSHLGMAREIAAMENRCFFEEKNEALKCKENANLLNIKIDSKKDCPRYSGAVLKNIEIKDSPSWMKSRLIASGMEPINNVVDITNYVMLETGNPLHAFDFKNIVSKDDVVQIVVRNAKKNEKLELLDGVILDLDEEDLLIANENKALALAGIKGGKDSGINLSTKQIVLEAANFKGFGIRKTRQRHHLNTESQMRFEKSLSPKFTELALSRAVELLKKYANAELVEVSEVCHYKELKQSLVLVFDNIEKLLGEKINKKEVYRILSSLGFGLSDNKDGWLVSVPFWRLDIEGEADLIEEIGRIYSYENIKEKVLFSDVKVPRKNNLRNLEWKIRDFLCAMGFDEVMNYSFYSPEDVNFCKIGGDHFEIANPLSPEISIMRRSLLPGIFKKVSLNAKYFDEFSIFEIGNIYNMKEDNNSSESKVLALAIADNKISNKEGALFYRLKGVLEEFCLNWHFENYKIEFFKEKDSSFYHPSRLACLLIEGVEVANFGQIEKSLEKKYNIKKSFVACEFKIDTFLNLIADKKKLKYKSVRKFPTVFRDISMFVDVKFEVEKVIAVIKKSLGEFLVSVNLFDVYKENSGSRKSLAFHLELGSDCTLTGDAVDSQMEKLMKKLELSGIEIRK